MKAIHNLKKEMFDRWIRYNKPQEICLSYNKEVGETSVQGR